jgi:predicted RecB family nuclease
MAFNASEFHFYYRLKPCALRVFLRAQGFELEEPDAYHKLLERLGQRHERRHLATLGAYSDVGGDADATRAAVANGERVIYQPGMRVVHETYGEIVGVPDFFIREDDGYVIRDCKLSRRFNEEDHAEIFRQLELYGWLYEQTFGTRPARLEAYMGDGQMQTVLYEPARALEVLAFIMGVKTGKEPVDPIGWSKCLDCGFNAYVWGRAKERHDVALLPSVDLALAQALYADGITTYDELPKRHTADTLAEVRKRVGKRDVKVGKAAARILQEAEAHRSGNVIQLKALELKKAPNLVMFDVEGIPPHLEHAEKTYLWGLKVFGDKPSPHLAALAEVGADGDERGWRRFLQNSRRVFEECGQISFVHWSPYERTQVRKYVGKYGDIDGIAARVLESLYDLHPVVEGSLVIPVPSYGLKLIERVAKYERKMPEAGGKWSMATYIEAVETDDPDKAAELIGEIVRYNEEDLDALWAVYRWLSMMS